MHAPTQSQRLLVENIYILFNPNRGDIKLGLVQEFLGKAYDISQEWGNIQAKIGWDINSKPRVRRRDELIIKQFLIRQTMQN